MQCAAAATPGIPQETRPTTRLLSRAHSQVMQYLEGKRKRFDLPLDTAGTAFQRRIWDALTDIPYGATTTYADVAHTIAQPQAVRAAASAIARNPLLLVVPCHRVIARSGALAGYRGGLPAKTFLLALERGALVPSLSSQPLPALLRLGTASH